MSAAAALDFRVNQVARGLKTRSTRTVALIAPELGNDFFNQLAEGAEHELSAAGYTLIIVSSANSTDEEERRLRHLSERFVDGFIVAPASSRGRHLAATVAGGIPVVLVDRSVEGAELDTVLADNEGGAYAATAALVAEGHRRLAFVGGDLALTTARERLGGFGRALADAGLEARDVRLGGMGQADGYRLMDHLLRETDPPHALFAVNILVHLGMERRLLEEGREALARYAMASFDETPYSAFMSACHCTVAQPAGAMGATAARLLLDRLAAARTRGADERKGSSGSSPRLVRLPTELIRYPRGAAAANAR